MANVILYKEPRRFPSIRLMAPLAMIGFQIAQISYLNVIRLCTATSNLTNAAQDQSGLYVTGPSRRNASVISSSFYFSRFLFPVAIVEPAGLIFGVAALIPIIYDFARRILDRLDSFRRAPALSKELRTFLHDIYNMANYSLASSLQTCLSPATLEIRQRAD